MSSPLWQTNSAPGTAVTEPGAWTTLVEASMADRNYIENLFGSIVVAVSKGHGHAVTNVRTIDDEAICTTAYSFKADQDLSGVGWKSYDGREAIAKRIALMWNACRHLSDQELAQLALASMASPQPPMRGRG